MVATELDILIISTLIMYECSPVV